MALSLMELIAQKKAALKSGNRQKTVKPPEGRSKWRILPGWRTDGDPTFYHDFGQHFIKDGTDTLKAVYVCVDKTFGKPCDVCSALDHAIKNTSDDAMVELLKKSKASGRVLLNALHVDGDKPTEVQILELSPNTFAEFLNIVQEWGAEVLDLDGGKDIIIERTGKFLQTKYSLQVAAKSVVVPADTLKKLHNLDEYVAQESEEQAKRALANLNAVAGMLPAPTVASSKPSLSDLSVDGIDIDDAALAAIEGTAARVESTPPFEPDAPKATATKAAAAPAAADSTGDSELDDLLAELG